MEDDPVLAKMLAEQLEYAMKQQAGVVSHAQLIAGGWTWPQIRRPLRRRELTRVHPRVYVNHTGPLTDVQRAWAAVLTCEPAALCGPSADALDAGPIHLAVERARGRPAPEGVVMHHIVGLADKIRAGTAPPRLAFEHNLVLGLQSAETETDVVAMLTDHIGRRGLTAAAVRRAVLAHPRLRHRKLVLALLDDIASGSESVLEHGFLTRVERPHGLPEPVRQRVRKGRDGVERRDLEYVELGVVVELDGRLGHASWQAGNRDASRDLADQVDGKTVLRLRWRQVMVESCWTAAALGEILQRHGWTGQMRRCPRCR